jgi:LuxR family maltose regulon positive regulatory protein
MRRVDGGSAPSERHLDDGANTRVPRMRDLAVRPPPEQRGMVRRLELLARLDRAPAAPMVLLVAPGGYGKTTLLSQWAERLVPACAWVTAGPGDNDPGLLAIHITFALQAALPFDARMAGLAPLTARSRPEPADLSTAVAALRRLGRSVVLVLDDLHEIQSRASLALVRTVLDDGGPALRVAAAGRVLPDLVLPDLVADGRCLELGPVDLAFTEAETRQVFVAARQAVAPDVARAVVQRTEGWPAGVYLAALAARQVPRGASSVARRGVISGDDVYITDYFSEELLAGEPADNVRFLLRTAVLERMSGPLCDALLETTGTAARLREAARRNLFVVPVRGAVGGGVWYRYHRLFREMLLAELRLREPGEEQRLHRRAAAWFDDEGLPDEAIPHALAGGDKARAARLVDLRGRQTFADGRRDAVQRWLEELDEDAMNAYPPLAVTAGWIWAFSAQPIRARSALRVARSARFAGPLPDGSSSLDSAAALLAAFLAPLGVERMVEDARRAVELEPAGTPGRAAALTILGAAHLLSGRPDLAVRELTEAIELGRAHRPDVAALARAELAVTALAAGGDADDDIAASLALLDEAGLQHDRVAVLAHAAAAWSAARRGDAAGVRRHVGMAQRIGADASTASFPWYSAQVSIVLAEVALQVGDALAARARLEEARQVLAQLLTEGVLRAQVDELADRLSGTGTPAARLPSPMALTAAEVRVLQLLPTHLSLGEIAEELGVSRNTIKTQVAATYRKLQAATRAEVVERGHELGLLVTAEGEADRPSGMR